MVLQTVVPGKSNGCAASSGEARAALWVLQANSCRGRGPARPQHHGPSSANQTVSTGGASPAGAV